MLETHLNDTGVAVGGFDVTEYFNGTPATGTEAFQSIHGEAKYYFASAGNKADFDAAPGKVLPQYNGWCAIAASEGNYYFSDPEAFIVQDGKLFLFVDDKIGGDTRPEWKQDSVGNQRNADGHWAAGDLSDRLL